MENNLTDKDRLNINVFYGLSLFNIVCTLKSSKSTFISILIYSILFWNLNWIKNDVPSSIQNDLVEIKITISIFVFYLLIMAVIFFDLRFIFSAFSLSILSLIILYTFQTELRGHLYIPSLDIFNQWFYVFKFVFIFCIFLFFIGIIYDNNILLICNFIFSIIFMGFGLSILIKYNSISTLIPVNKLLINLYINSVYLFIGLFILMFIYKELKFAMSIFCMIIYYLLIYSFVFYIDLMIKKIYKNKN